MEKLCGVLENIGTLTGGYLVASNKQNQCGQKRNFATFWEASLIDSVTIGTTTLKKARCAVDLHSSFMTDRKACIYIFRHFWRVPTILGVKYEDDNSKYMVSTNYVRSSCLEYIIAWPLLMLIPGVFVGMVIGKVIGARSGDLSPMLGVMCGIGLAWWNSVRIWKDYLAASAD